MAFSVVVKDVQKTFVTGRGRAKRTTPVLRGVSLSVRPKEMVAIVGPSGSGKSTLLYCMSGLEAVDGGSIEVMGQQVADASRNALSRIRRQHVGFIFQSYNLLPSLSARENVALPARLAGRPVSDARLNETLERVGLAGRERNRPQDLSGGEQQRVAIARVLASAPDVVFADEPTGALDTKNGREVLAMLSDIADEPSRSVVMVTHDLEAASLADRVLILRDGLILREMGRSSSKEILDAMEAAA